ncbi:retrotransposon protein, putative, ty1-copia subclass [Tanacetum coccineum]
MMNLTTLPKSFWGYALDSAVRILNMVPTKKVYRTPYEIWHGKAPKLSYLGFFEDNLIVQEASRSHGPLIMSRSNEGLELIQEEDTQPSENTSKEHNEVVPIEYELWDFNELPNYKAALSDPESDKWLKAMNTEISIRILLAIAAFYDYEIWQIDVKTAFLNGHLSGDVYMVQLEGFVDPKYPNKVCKLQRSIYGLNRFQQNPGEIHWTAVKTILKYLRNTKDMVLVYGAKPEDELKVSCYADASFQTDKDDTKSQTGYVFVLNDRAVDRKSTKQSTKAMSSTKFEYIAAAEASMDAV